VAFAAGGAGGASADDGRERRGHPDKAKNVILFVGDGMGAAQRNAGALTGVGVQDDLVMDSLPYAGLVHTDSVDDETFITDSAAAGTSYATGVKTYNGAIGVDADGTPVETLVERAEAAGKATGLVTTGEVTDATTAAFGAHVADRGDQTEIARQFIEETGVDVLLGGGEDFWYPAGDDGAVAGGSSRSDEGNLVERAQEKGYEYVTGADELAAADSDQVLGLFANRTMFEAEPEPAGEYEPAVSLEEMTRNAIETLSDSRRGFVLVVEEEAIDEMAHSNNAALTMKGVLELDKAVAVGKKFAEENRDTLVVTTADHETGGMAIESLDDVEYPDESGDGVSAEDGPFEVADSDHEFRVDWTTTGHTNVDVPLTAMGPGAERLTGVHENTHVHQVMLESLQMRGGHGWDHDRDRRGRR
jgi:alkaline phosphatase